MLLTYFCVFSPFSMVCRFFKPNLTVLEWVRCTNRCSRSIFSALRSPFRGSAFFSLSIDRSLCWYGFCSHSPAPMLLSNRVRYAIDDLTVLVRREAAARPCSSRRTRALTLPLSTTPNGAELSRTVRFPASLRFSLEWEFDWFFLRWSS